ncbi:hypothetical protein ASPCAL01689 [Aspergillus calidoustus]|uniref:Uncharacterized protein n=1 Tax=Aspergillus calidoustus TaxID=454130 RepID=A0A0U5GLS1_ASPCI|nr:hypothetical protein ASPCAL01689 [Aspergillus calidoustus]
MVDIADEIYASRREILQSLFANKISAPDAAAQLASATLADDTTLEGALGRLWNLIIALAADSLTHHDKLVDVLVDISELPDEKNPPSTGTGQSENEPESEPGSSLTLHDMVVWRDLPTLGWTFRDEWNFSVNPNSSAEKRAYAIRRWININRFAALLMATEEPVFASYSWFALVTLRQALETPIDQMSEHDPLDAWVPAAAAWIEVLGVEIYEWEEEFPSGGNRAPGKGGPLWEGKHGFCKGRWGLWRERFGDMARGGRVSESVRKVAGDAEVMMKEIEAGDVE